METSIKAIILSGLITVLIGCGETENHTTTEKTQTVDKSNNEKTMNPTPTPSAKLTGCYMHVMERDTLVAHLQQDEHIITGRLTFDNYQKDGSTGKVQGKLENGVLKLVYSFQSEGMNSVMERYFKAGDGYLIPGEGEMENKGDTSYFKNPSTIHFQENRKLLKTDCSSLPPKYL